MLVICYSESSRKPEPLLYDYAKTDGTVLTHEIIEKAVNEWVVKNPDAVIHMIFDATQDIYRMEQERHDSFLRDCLICGLHPDDYGRKLLDPYSTGRAYQLIGCEPGKRKYKYRIQDMRTGVIMRADKNWVDNAAAKWDRQAAAAPGTP